MSERSRRPSSPSPRITCNPTEWAAGPGKEQAVPHEWFEIRVRGQLSRQWAVWLDGFTLTNTDEGDAILRGLVADQAALHGVLHHLRDLGLSLVAIARIDPPTRDQPRK